MAQPRIDIGMKLDRLVTVATFVLIHVKCQSEAVGSCTFMNNKA